MEIYHKLGSISKGIQEYKRDMRFNPKVRIHKESDVLVEELTNCRVPLNPFLTQVVTKTDLELLTITKMGNTNFPRLTTQRSSSRTTFNRLGAQLQE
jgi:hypothetical protein